MKIVSRLLKSFGPGVITGAADDDPSGIATYSSAGAQFNLKLLWSSFFTIPLMVAVQEMCARIGMVTGRGLLKNFKIIFSRKILLLALVLLFLANTFNIGADLSMMSAGLRLLIPAMPAWWLIIILAVLCLVLEILLSYKTYFKILKWLCLSLFAYWLTAFMVVGNWGEVIKNIFLIRLELNTPYLMMLVAFLGTTISPYLFFWQSSGEVENEIEDGRKNIADRKGASKGEISQMRWDVWIGMIFSNLTTFFIIVTTATVLHRYGIYQINTAADAAIALRPLAGDFAYYLFAIGILGTGLLAIPILAGSVAYALAEIFNWKEGLSIKLTKAKGFYGIMSIAVIFGVLMNFFGLNPVKALIYSAVLNGLTAPLFIFMIIKTSNSKKIMGKFTNSKLVNVFGWLTFALMTTAGCAFLVSLFM